MKARIIKALIPFWNKVSVCQIVGTRLWRVEVSKKKGLGYQDAKSCAYAILDTLCRDFSITCVVTVV